MSDEILGLIKGSLTCLRGLEITGLTEEDMLIVRKSETPLHDTKISYIDCQGLTYLF
jgi:hypothetical protein